MAKNSKAIVKWDEQLAKSAEMASRVVEGMGGESNFISLKAGRMTYKGGEVPGNKLSVVVLDHVLENCFYEGKYDPENIESPVCFAFARVKADLKPHEKSHDPQHAQCADCPHNEFGSADTGRGKACQNRVRLALIPEGDLGKAKDCEVAFLKVPVTSGKAWAGYVQQIASGLKRPPFGVVTEISVVPDPKSQFRLEFKLLKKIEDDKALEAIFGRIDAVQKAIENPYVYQEPEKKGGKVSKKKAKAKAKGAKF